MKFEINVKNRVNLQKLALVKQLANALGINLFVAKSGIADKIFELLENGVESASIIVDSETIDMKPLFSIQGNNSLYENNELGITIKLVKDPEEINLCELLKDCIGMSFYMPHYGVVVLESINIAPGGRNFMYFQASTGYCTVFNNGKYVDDGEICIFPSKEQRDWSLFVLPWTPKEGERVWVKVFAGSPIWIGKYFKKMVGTEFACGVYQTKGESNLEFFKVCVPFEPIPW